jgi:hypothetical protein
MRDTPCSHAISAVSRIERNSLDAEDAGPVAAHVVRFLAKPVKDADFQPAVESVAPGAAVAAADRHTQAGVCLPTLPTCAPELVPR